MTPAQVPALSVVVVAPLGYAAIRRTVASLREQSLRERIELVLVVPGEADARPPLADLAGFASVSRVAVGAIEQVDAAAAAGVREARADLVAVVEDHAFPEPDWAEALLAAFASGPWAAVAPAIENANPATRVSWSDLLLSYGRWGGARSGREEVAALPGHNVAYRRAALLALGDRLETLSSDPAALQAALRGAGHRFLFDPRARVRHVNPSKLGATLAMRFARARVFAASRAESWSAWRRALYVLAAPLIPCMYLPGLLRDARRAGRLGPLARAAPVLGTTLLCHAAGEALGYALGAGDAPGRLAAMEFDRARFVTPGERSLLDPDAH